MTEEKEVETSSVPDKPVPAPAPEIEDDHRLPDKSLFRLDEVADYFSVTERTIRLWIDHGHLAGEKIVGSVRVPRESILRCRFNVRL